MNTSVKLLTTEQTAELLAIQKKSLEMWRWQGKGPIHRKIGRLVRYVESDVMAWIDDQARRSTSDKGQHRA